MPMPHQEMRRLIKRRITGLEGTERIKVLQGFLDELPGYYQGPYGEIRKGLLQLIDEAQVRRSVRHQEQFFIPKEGASQVALVGPPNAGKSSLLKALTGRQVAVGDYPFTTLHPIAGMVRMEGAVVQMIDMPGLLDGAVDGRGGGRAVLGAIRMADAVLFVAPLTEEGVEAFSRLLHEVTEEGGVRQPAGLVATKADLPGADELFRRLSEQYPLVPSARCSVAAGEGLDGVRQLLWRVSGLKRVFSKPRGKPASPDAVVLAPEATVTDFIESLNRAWLDHFQQARVTGPSARFAGQVVGLQHVLADGDVVELVLR